MRTLLPIVFLLFLANLAEAQNTFVLRRQDSNVNFLVNSSMLPIEGKIQTYSGKLVKTGKLANQFEIYLDCDLTSIKITSQQLNGLPIADLMASVKNSIAHFEGKPVSQKPDGTLKISGTLKWKNKAYEVSFPVSMKQNTNDQITLVGKINGSGDQLVEEIPALALFQIQNASANATLEFRRP